MISHQEYSNIPAAIEFLGTQQARKLKGKAYISTVVGFSGEAQILASHRCLQIVNEHGELGSQQTRKFKCEGY